jgi:hypothetical protein
MNRILFQQFTIGKHTLEVYQNGQQIFVSSKDRLQPLLEYIATSAPQHQGVVIFDRIVGRAAALLAVKAGCAELYSPMGSELAIAVLREHDIKHDLGKLVPYIQRDNQTEMCPMERLSIGKEPDEFYRTMKKLTSPQDC